MDSKMISTKYFFTSVTNFIIIMTITVIHNIVVLLISIIMTTNKYWFCEVYKVQYQIFSFFFQAQTEPSWQNASFAYI